MALEARDRPAIQVPPNQAEVRSRPVPDPALDYLASADPVMRGLIERFGPLEYRVDGDLWRALIGSIAGQQLSVAAAGTIRGRLAQLGGEAFPTPEVIAALPADVLRGCGLSRAKTSYLQEVARRWVGGEVPVADLASLPDEQVIEILIRLRGVGRWTAEMVLLFSLGRSDILALDDLGLRSAVQRAYQLAERPDRLTLQKIGEPWRPYRSYASLYLWRSLHAEA